MSTSEIRTFLRLACVLIGVWASSVGLAEVGFRLWGDEPSSDLKGMYAPFESGNYKNGAFVDTDAFLASGHLTVHTDGLGLRCDAARRFGTKVGDAIDILLVGDSQGFGNGVNYENTIAGTLATIRAGRGLRVANASVGGHTLASQYQLARWLVDEQDLRVSTFVLLLTPAMINSGGVVNRANVGADGRLYGDEVNLATHVNLWIKTHSVAYSRVRDAARNAGIGLDPARKSASVFDFYDASTPSERTIEILLADVRKFQEFAEMQGATIQLVYVPLTVEAEFDPIQQAAGRVGMSLNPDIPLGIATAVAGTLNVPLHNLKPVLEGIRSAGQMLNVKGDFHYSSALSQACGSSLAAQLDASPVRHALRAHPRN